MDLVPGKTYKFVYGDGSEETYIVKFVKAALRNGMVILYFEDDTTREQLAMFPVHFGSDSGQIKSIVPV